ncbi:major facilitator superfamily domain-containing protein [Lobosporangium transversale]|uniref:Major facilitator superfamily domain-containing protein n=1 Tax=Lobosporangium transversale TaxID=64571 RepID=A0A1Y2GPB6_9FUNG|nr:major facilitator superfamily domain-containing protein [Lobosporangium transversale]ORZ17538.1 major facilitator superfamily domain-containing protein [Lobosporangium transversale]|eukprot:XP_021881925.1 major facilitator superfamily domain-containing protein [Lobosporangium transversale]
MVAIGYVSIYGIFQSQYDDIYGAQGASTSDVSLVGSLAVGFQFGFTIISGPLMNRFGYKVVLWSGSIIGSLGLLLASWGSQLWHLYLTQGAMFGIGVSLLNLAVTAILPLWYDKYRSFAMGICFCGAGIGGLVFGFIIPALINAVGLRWALRIFAILHFVCTAFASIVIRAPRQLSGSRIIVPKEVLNLQILKDPGFIFLLISAAFFGFAYMVPFTYIPSYTKDVVGLDPNIQGGHLISIMSAANAVGLITIGFAADCLGVIRVTTFILMAAGASCFLWMASYSYSALVWFSIMYGFFSGGFFILVAAIIANTIGLANLGSGLTIIFLVNTPGNILTLPIAGNMLGSTGGYKGMIGYNAAMYFGSALFLCILMFYNHYTRRVDSV